MGTRGFAIGQSRFTAVAAAGCDNPCWCVTGPAEASFSNEPASYLHLGEGVAPADPAVQIELLTSPTDACDEHPTACGSGALEEEAGSGWRFAERFVGLALTDHTCGRLGAVVRVTLVDGAGEVIPRSDGAASTDLVELPAFTNQPIDEPIELLPGWPVVFGWGAWVS